MCGGITSDKKSDRGQSPSEIPINLRHILKCNHYNCSDLVDHGQEDLGVLSCGGVRVAEGDLCHGQGRPLGRAVRVAVAVINRNRA